MAKCNANAGLSALHSFSVSAASTGPAWRGRGSVGANWRHLPGAFMAASLLVGGNAFGAGGTAANSSAVTVGDHSSSVQPISTDIAEAARRFGIPASWISAVMRVESGGKADAVSPKGAMGLMQIMPETWTDLRLRYSLGANPFDPGDNITAGAAYLRELYDAYGSPGFLAAYNAGPSRYEEHLAGGQALPFETQNYLAVLAPVVGEDGVGKLAIAASRVGSWTQSGLFAAHAQDGFWSLQASFEIRNDRHVGGTKGDRDQLSPQSQGLFAVPSAGGWHS